MKDIRYYYNSEGSIWLNIASSTNVIENFVNIDNDIHLHLLKYYRIFKWLLPMKYRIQIDEFKKAKKKAMLIRYDCRKPLFFPDNSVDHIVCSHFLEHVYLKEMENILKDYFRILKPNATLHIILPDLKKQVDDYINNLVNGMKEAADDFINSTMLSKKERGSFRYCLLELHGGFGFQHRWMYDQSSISEKLKRMGFEILSMNETPSRYYHYGDESIHIIVRKNKSII